MTLYALVQWRGIVKRGGLILVIIPILTSCVADGLYLVSIDVRITLLYLPALDVRFFEIEQKCPR